MTRKLTIVLGFLFTLGNICWDKFGWNEPKVMYIPLAFYLLFLILAASEPSKKPISKPEIYFWKYFIALAGGNIVKQAFYNPTLKQLNDYAWGALCTIILLIFLIQWAIQHKHGGKKLRKG